ncbi:hypothetical protein Salat_0212700 [Sesamum alatum]|uniref:Uncharacterized protein n=1 Tax=Sesamum alatum TaxID=300844 RepID=A0AAE1YZW9_9LAMI|nr:hypothetical protein Salat_0212700 [Sesamum alatum]
MYVRTGHSSFWNRPNLDVSSIKVNSRGIFFDDKDLEGFPFPHDYPVVMTMDVVNFTIQKVLVDNGSSTSIMFLSVLIRMDLHVEDMKQVNMTLIGLEEDPSLPRYYGFANVAWVHPAEAL